MIFYSWPLLLRDALEVGIIALSCYAFLAWLNKDENRQLLYSVYGYWACMTMAYMLDLQTVFAVGLYALPLGGALLIIFHKEQLQKNYIKRTTYSLSPAKDAWIDMLIRGFLQAMNAGMATAAVIEKDEPLVLKVPFFMTAECSLELLHLITSSADFDQTKMLWFDSRGKLKAFNAVPLHDAQKDALHAFRTWQCDALVITLKTDALVVGMDPRSRTFIIIVQGKMMEGVSVNAAIRLMKHYFFGIVSNNNHDEKERYAPITKKFSGQQKQS